MKYFHEVDLRSRETGDSIICIYSGDDYDVAEKLTEEYNKTLPDYDSDLGDEEYHDGHSDGLFAYHYIIDSEDDVHDIGYLYSNYIKGKDKDNNKPKNTKQDEDYYEKALKNRIDANKSLLNAWKDRINTELVNCFNDDCFEKNVIDMLLYTSEIKKRNKELEMCLAIYQVGKGV